MLAGWTDWWLAQQDYWLDVKDDDYQEAVNNCYSALCYNKYGTGWVGCPYKLEDVGRVIVAYIYYFVHHSEPDKIKYYYDEFSDRQDPYRKKLVAIISQMASYSKTISEEFTNSVLSYMYWGIKRKTVSKALLQPLQVEKFKDPQWYISGIWKSVYGITDAVISFFKKVFEAAEKLIYTAGNVVAGVAGGVAGVLNVTGNAISYLPWIIGGGILLIAGLEYKHYKKSGEIITPYNIKNKLL